MKFKNITKFRKDRTDRGRKIEQAEEERQNRQRKKTEETEQERQSKKDRVRKTLTNNCLFCGKFKRKSQCIHKQFPHQYNLDDLSTNYLLFKIRQKKFKRPIVGIDINRPRTLPSNIEWN